MKNTNDYMTRKFRYVPAGERDGLRRNLLVRLTHTD